MSSNGCSCVPKQFYFPKEAAGLWATVCQPLDYTKVCSGVTQAKLKGKPQKYHTNPKDLNSTPEQQSPTTFRGAPKIPALKIIYNIWNPMKNSCKEAKIKPIIRRKNNRPRNVTYDRNST